MRPRDSDRPMGTRPADDTDDTDLSPRDDLVEALARRLEAIDRPEPAAIEASWRALEARLLAEGDLEPEPDPDPPPRRPRVGLKVVAALVGAAILGAWLAWTEPSPAPVGGEPSATSPSR